MLVESWCKNDIFTIGDLVVGTSFITTTEFICKYLELNWLDYHALVNSVPIMWRVWLTDDVLGESKGHLYDKLLQVPKVAKEVYGLLLDDDGILTKCYWRLIESSFDIEIDEYISSFDSFKL